MFLVVALSHYDLCDLKDKAEVDLSDSLRVRSSQRAKLIKEQRRPGTRHYSDSASG